MIMNKLTRMKAEAIFHLTDMLTREEKAQIQGLICAKCDSQDCVTRDKWKTHITSGQVKPNMTTILKAELLLLMHMDKLTEAEDAEIHTVLCDACPQNETCDIKEEYVKDAGVVTFNAVVKQ